MSSEGDEAATTADDETSARPDWRPIFGHDEPYDDQVDGIECRAPTRTAAPAPTPQGEGSIGSKKGRQQRHQEQRPPGSAAGSDIRIRLGAVDSAGYYDT